MEYRCVTNLTDIQQYLNGAQIVAFDLETAPDEMFRGEDRAALDPHKSHITGMSFSVAEGDGIYIPIAHKIGKNLSSLTELWQFHRQCFL